MNPWKQRWQSKRKKESQFSTLWGYHIKSTLMFRITCAWEINSHLSWESIVLRLYYSSRTSVLSSNEWKWFWAIWRLSGKSAMLGLQCWQWGRAPMVSWQLFLCAFQLTPKRKTFQRNFHVAHTSYLPFDICLPLCATGLVFLYLI